MSPEWLFDFAKLESSASTKAIINGVAIFLIGIGFSELNFFIHRKLHQIVKKVNEKDLFVYTSFKKFCFKIIAQL